ncbi:hypothetical protein AMTRI_Chr06g192550 [Amborella trichopoda]
MKLQIGWVSSSYRNECCHAFRSLRREFLQESILKLGFQKLDSKDGNQDGVEGLFFDKSMKLDIQTVYQ